MAGAPQSPRRRRRGRSAALAGVTLVAAALPVLGASPPAGATTLAVTDTVDGAAGSLVPGGRHERGHRSGHHHPRGPARSCSTGARRATPATPTGGISTWPVPSPSPSRVGAGTTVLRQTCAGERVLQADDVPVLTLRNLTAEGGGLTGADPDAVVQGGGVRAGHDVVLDGVHVHDNGPRGADRPASWNVHGIGLTGGAVEGGGLWVGGSLRRRAPCGTRTRSRAAPAPTRPVRTIRR